MYTTENYNIFDDSQVKNCLAFPIIPLTRGTFPYV